MQLGFRRLGHHYYTPACRACKACISLRIPVETFKPNKNQRQIWRRNQDLEVKVERVSFSEEKYQFYLEYQQSRWDKSEDMTAERFIETYIDQPGTGLEFDYTLDGQRVGLGWVDWSPQGCSSVYFAWKCDSRRSLGIYSVMYEIEWAKQNAIPYVYLGLYVDGCDSMTYKANFHPHQRKYRDQDWVDWTPGTTVDPA
jgi:arginyl-tRNA--protein-N-Asp/Glu arginylyltransferase